MSGNRATVFDLPLKSPRNFSISPASFSAPPSNSLRTSSEIFTPGGGTGRTFSGMLSAGPSAGRRMVAVISTRNAIFICLAEFKCPFEFGNKCRFFLPFNSVEMSEKAGQSRRGGIRSQHRNHFFFLTPSGSGFAYDIKLVPSFRIKQYDKIFGIGEFLSSLPLRGAPAAKAAILNAGASNE